MTEPINTGIWLLMELASRLSALTAEEFKAPNMPRRHGIRVLGEATPYQKALVTLLHRINDEHEALHLETDLRFGGHIDLPVEHEFLHAAPQILGAMLSVNLSNTFKELSDDVDYYISPSWKVGVVKKKMGPKPLQTMFNPFQ